MIFMLALTALPALAQTAAQTAAPTLPVDLKQIAGGSSSPVQIIVLLTLLSFVPAFMISELKTAFQIGFILFIPFLIIDMAVSSVLLSMGMMQLPPVIVSMPLKLLLFVMVDGWYLIVGSLVKSLI